MATPANDTDWLLAMLCSQVALTADDVKPLKHSEWQAVEALVTARGGTGIEALAGLPAGELSGRYGIHPEMASRIEQLLSREAAFASELERLSSAGIRPLSVSNPRYPRHWKTRLGARAPAVVWGAGDVGLLNGRGVAIVGSRDVDDAGATFARLAGTRAAQAGLTVISGGARGVDREAVGGATAEGGRAVVLLADSLEATLRNAAVRRLVARGCLALVAPFHPAARFSVPAAMARNRLIYTLGQAALVVSSANGSGGTWAGATENLRNRWVPLLVRAGRAVPEGNRALIDRGGIPFESERLASASRLADFVASHAAG